MNRFAQLALALFALCLTAACGEVGEMLPEQTWPMTLSSWTIS